MLCAEGGSNIGEFFGDGEDDLVVFLFDEAWVMGGILSR
jgi:hypothetical protein